MVSLPEGVFTLCATSLTNVVFDGISFPQPCPAGQIDATAPATGAHYCERNQAKGLEAIYAETAGEAWHRHDGWEAAAAADGPWEPCNGVEGASSWEGVVCGSGELAGRVTAVHLGSNNMDGQFPAGALASLSSLSVVDMSSNLLQGAIDGIGSLVHLRQFSAYSNQLSGTIDAVSSLLLLDDLSLDNNGLAGELWGVQGLENLQILSLYNNEFVGGLDALAGLTGLLSLYLGDNRLAGELSMLSSLGSLERLGLSGNELTGGLDAVASLSALQRLDLGDNQLSGGINAVQALNNLQRLHLCCNSLSGAIDGVASLVNLEQLDLHGNDFTGDIGAVETLVNLEELFLQENRLSGGIEPVAVLNKATFVNISSNLFSGVLPELGLPAASIVAFVSFNNDLSGMVTPDFSVWCDSIPHCSIDTPQQAALNATMSALTALSTWTSEGIVTIVDDDLDNAAPWVSDDGNSAGDPCQQPWPGVICDADGRLRHLMLPDVGIEAAGSTGVLPDEVLALGDARQLHILPQGVEAEWPAEAVAVTNGPPASTKSDSAVFELTAGGQAGQHVVDFGEVWLTWRHSNASDVSAAGSSPPVPLILDRETGVGSVNVSLESASGWPRHSAVDLTVSLHGALNSDEPGFSSSPPLPTDRRLHTWRYDTWPPTASFVRAPEPAVASRSVQLSFGCSETSCRYDYSLNGAAWVPVAAGDADDDDAEPDNSVSEGFAGVTDVLSTPPRITPERSAVFELQAREGVGGFEYSLDDEPWKQSLSSTIEVTDLAAGEHTMALRAVHASTGAADALPFGYVWTVEPSHQPVAPLVVSVASGPPRVTPLATVSFEFSATHDHTWYEYRVDGSVWRSTLPRLTVGPLAAGEHTLDLRGSSLEEHCEGKCSVAVGQAYTWVFEPSGAGVRIELPEDGGYAVQARATDSAGNTGPAGSAIEFVVDTVAPLLTKAEVDDSASVAWPSEGDPRVGPAPLSDTQLTIPVDGLVNITVRAADGVGASAACTGCFATCAAVIGTVSASSDFDDGIPCGSYSLDADPQADQARALEVPSEGLSDGLVSLAVAAVDAAGNSEADPHVFVVLLDDNAPTMHPINVTTTHRLVDGLIVLASSEADLVVTCDDAADAGCAFEVFTDDAGDPARQVVYHDRIEAAPGHAQVTFTNLADGNHTLSALAWDAAGHVSDSAATVVLLVDTMPPATQFSLPSGSGSDLAGLQATGGTTLSDVTLVVRSLVEGELLEGFHSCVDFLPSDASDATATGPVSSEALPAEACSAAPPEGSSSSLPAPWTLPLSERADGLGVGGELQLSGLASGAWRVSVWAVDAAGNTATNVSALSFSVDTRAPIVGVAPSMPPPGQLITRHRTTTVRAVASEPAARFTAELDDGGTFDGDASGVLDISLLPSAADGQHSVEIFAVDVAGNDAVEAATWSWWLDTTPPVVDATELTLAVHGSGTPPTIAAQATNVTAPNVAAACVQNDPAGSAPAAACTLMYTLDDEPAVALSEGTAFSVSALSDGAHSLRIGAEDAAGNAVGAAAEASVHWVVDTVAPVAGDLQLERYSASPTVDLLFDCRDRTLCAVEYRVTGRQAVGGCEGVGVDDGSGAGEGALTSTPWAAAARAEESTVLDASQLRQFNFSATLEGLSDGEQLLEVRAIDAAGQLSVETRSATFFVDTVAPAMPVFDLTPGAFARNEQFTWDLRVPGELVAPPGLDSTTVEFKFSKVGDEASAEWVPVQIPDDPNVVDASTFRLTTPTTETQGQHRLSVRATDAAGNVGPPAEFVLTVATDEPATAFVLTPAAESGINFARFVVRATLSDDLTDGMAVTDDNVTVEVRMGTDDWESVSSGCRTATADDPGGSGAVLCVHELHELAVGRYSLRARAVDAAGLRDETPEEFDWTVSKCSEQQYAVFGPDGSLQCNACPTGAWCGDELRDNVTYADVAARAGWWTSGSAADEYYQCPMPRACLSAQGSGNRSLCAQGHTSRLCSLCEEGFYLHGDSCEPCPDTQAESWFFVIGVGVALVISAAAVFKLRAFLPMVRSLPAHRAACLCAMWICLAWCPPLTDQPARSTCRR